jgi:hypothetical protein
VTVTTRVWTLRLSQVSGWSGVVLQGRRPQLEDAGLDPPLLRQMAQSPPCASSMASASSAVMP